MDDTAVLSVRLPESVRNRLKAIAAVEAELGLPGPGTASPAPG